MLNVSFSPFGVYYPVELAVVLNALPVVPCWVGELAVVLKVDRGYHNSPTQEESQGSHGWPIDRYPGATGHQH